MDISLRHLLCFVAAACWICAVYGSSSPMLIHSLLGKPLAVPPPTNLLAVPQPPSPITKQRAASLLAATPLLFHSADDNLFVARSAQFSVRVHGAGFALARPGQADVLTVDLVGASSTAQPAGEQRHGDAVVNYFRGSDASQWRSGVPVWERVRVASTYDGIDVVYYTAASGQLEFDFALQPGADPSRIAMRFAAAWSLAVDSDGSLTASHPDWGVLTLPKPIIYQPLADSTASIDGGYTLINDNAAGFWLGGYDAALPLVIDPLVFSTYLGGSGSDYASSVAVDGAGNIAVVSTTTSTDFPTTSGAYNTSLNGGKDVVVSKFDASGALVYSTYLGGSDDDLGVSIAADSTGNMFVAGQTASTNFPTTLGAYDASPNGLLDVFVAKFSASGALVYSTYLGGSADDYNFCIAVDSAGNFVISGTTNSGNFPTTSGAFDTTVGGITDGFMAKFSASGTLKYSTYIGGSVRDSAQGVAFDSAGNIVVAGYTSSGDFPTTSTAFQTASGGNTDAFVTKFDASGALVYSTYLGGSGDDYGIAVAVDSAGNIFVTGEMHSSNFPTTPDAFDTSFSGNDAFVSEFNASGALVYSTYLGGSNGASASSITVDSAGNYFVTGHTQSADFPTTPDAFDPTFNDAIDTFVIKFNANSGLVYSTFIGAPSGYQTGADVAVDGAGNIVVVGWTSSSDFPTTTGALDTTLGGANDGFVTKLFECSRLDDCSAHGQCIAPDTCDCEAGWAGSADCSQFECLSLNNCSSHGDCIGPDTCSCDAGWTGSPDCSESSCESLNDCSAHGNCIAPDTCDCDSGWTARPDCSQFECYALNDCSSHGACTGPNSCSCFEGWTGSRDCSVCRGLANTKSFASFHRRLQRASSEAKKKSESRPKV